MRIYHISWQNYLGFCCELDEECAKELVGECMFVVFATLH